MPYPTLAGPPSPSPGKEGGLWTEESIPLPEAAPGGHPQPRISIVIPSYNQATYLETAICSVLDQNYPDLELIVVDGGSTDGSPAIIQKYAPRLAWWVSQPDRGQSHAINRGFARCTGQIITFLSADDYYLPGTLHHVARNWAQAPHHGAIIGAFRFLDAGQLSEPVMPHLATPAPVDLSLGPPGTYRLHQVATFYSRAALDAVGRHVREDLHYVMDRELLYRVLRQYPVLLISRPYGVFRRHPEAKTADILPFAREFARLYRLSRTGHPAHDRRRERMARYRLARGYMKLANQATAPRTRWTALLRALLAAPRHTLRPSSLRFWLRTLAQGGRSREQGAGSKE